MGLHIEVITDPRDVDDRDDDVFTVVRQRTEEFCNLIGVENLISVTPNADFSVFCVVHVGEPLRLQRGLWSWLFG